MTIKKSCLLGLSIVGAIVGVGFASGKEINTFFLSHGWLSILFCFFAGILFAIFSYLIFLFSDKKRKIAVYDVKNGSKNAKLHNFTYFENFYNCVLFLCQVSICSAMFAGLESVTKLILPSFNLMFLIKLAVLALAIIFLCQAKANIHVLNFILSILMILAILFMFVWRCAGGNIIKPIKVCDAGIFYLPILYVGMNVFTAEPLLINIGEGLNDKKERVITSVFIGLFVWLALTLVLLVMMFSDVSGGDMPMINIAAGIGAWFKCLYVALMVICILSTLLSTAFGASQILGKVIKEKAAIIISLCLSFVISFIGFSKVVDVVYPLIGAMCLVCVVIKLFIYRSAL